MLAGYNFKTGIALALLSLMVFFFRPRNVHIFPKPPFFQIVDSLWASLQILLHHLVVDWFSCSRACSTFVWPSDNNYQVLWVLFQRPCLLPGPVYFATRYGSSTVQLAYISCITVVVDGGLNVAVFPMSVLPMVFSMTAEGSNGRYAFVPGGVYLHKRTFL